MRAQAFRYALPANESCGSALVPVAALLFARTAMLTSPHLISPHLPSPPLTSPHPAALGMSPQKSTVACPWQSLLRALEHVSR